jgi:thiaminase
MCHILGLTMLQSLILIPYRYVLDIGQSQDWFALQIALAPCLIGYGVIARRLYDDPKTKREGNIYMQWIENYVADDYVEAVKIGSGM